VLREVKAAQAQKAIPAILGQKDLRAPQVVQDQLVLLGQQDHKDLQVLKVLKEVQAHRELLEQKAILAILEHRVFQ
jgi:hypothetical protein